MFFLLFSLPISVTSVFVLLVALTSSVSAVCSSSELLGSGYDMAYGNTWLRNFSSEMECDPGLRVRIMNETVKVDRNEGEAISSDHSEYLLYNDRSVMTFLDTTRAGAQLTEVTDISGVRDPSYLALVACASGNETANCTEPFNSTCLGPGEWVASDVKALSFYSLSFSCNENPGCDDDTDQNAILPPTTAFKSAVEALPESISSSADQVMYDELFDTYGTHYISEIYIGYRITRFEYGANSSDPIYTLQYGKAVNSEDEYYPVDYGLLSLATYVEHYHYNGDINASIAKCVTLENAIDARSHTAHVNRPQVSDATCIPSTPGKGKSINTMIFIFAGFAVVMGCCGCICWYKNRKKRLEQKEGSTKDYQPLPVNSQA